MEKNWDVVDYSGVSHFKSATELALLAFCFGQVLVWSWMELEEGQGIQEECGPRGGGGSIPGKMAPEVHDKGPANATWRCGLSMTGLHTRAACQGRQGQCASCTFFPATLLPPTTPPALYLQPEDWLPRHPIQFCSPRRIFPSFISLKSLSINCKSCNLRSHSELHRLGAHIFQSLSK